MKKKGIAKLIFKVSTALQKKIWFFFGVANLQMREKNGFLEVWHHKQKVLNYFAQLVSELSSQMTIQELARAASSLTEFAGQENWQLTTDVKKMLQGRSGTANPDLINTLEEDARFNPTPSKGYFTPKFRSIDRKLTPKKGAASSYIWDSMPLIWAALYPAYARS